MNNKPDFRSKSWRAARFQIEDGPVFSGYTRGDTWNGWECPAFTRNVAEQICAWVERSGAKAYVEEEPDQVFVIDPYNEDSTEFFEGQDISVSGTTIHVYPVGAYSWVWDEVSLDSQVWLKVPKACPHCGEELEIQVAVNVSNDEVWAEPEDQQTVCPYCIHFIDILSTTIHIDVDLRDLWATRYKEAE